MSGSTLIEFTFEDAAPDWLESLNYTALPKLMAEELRTKYAEHFLTGANK
jgi:hypothetical protein